MESRFLCTVKFEKWAMYSHVQKYWDFIMALIQKDCEKIGSIKELRG